MYHNDTRSTQKFIFFITFSMARDMFPVSTQPLFVGSSSNFLVSSTRWDCNWTTWGVRWGLLSLSTRSIYQQWRLMLLRWVMINHNFQAVMNKPTEVSNKLIHSPSKFINADLILYLWQPLSEVLSPEIGIYRRCKKAASCVTHLEHLVVRMTLSSSNIYTTCYNAETLLPRTIRRIHLGLHQIVAMLRLQVSH